MKNLILPFFALGALLFAPGVGVCAEKPAATPDTRPELTVVVVDSLNRSGSSESSHFDRIARMFTEVFEKQKWPVKIAVERFGAGAADYPLELRVFYQGIREDTPVDLTFRAWMVLYDHGTKHDFGVIRYQSNPRIGEQRVDSLDAAARGAALIAVTKIEPILFPKTVPAKP